MYKSIFRELKPVFLPEFSNIRVLMLPVMLQDIESLPNDLRCYKQTYQELVDLSPVKEGVAYLTIDERYVEKGQTLRVRGLHVDGIGAEGKMNLSIWATHGLRCYLSSMWDEGAKKWYYGAAGIGGMITVSNPEGCRAWHKEFTGRIEWDGSCEKLREHFPDSESTVFKAGMAYWCNSSCVHESIPMAGDAQRVFVRLSMPSKAPWYSGYTTNPKGVKPTGPVVPVGAWRTGYEKEVVLNG
jgi:hypothetical protein